MFHCWSSLPYHILSIFTLVVTVSATIWSTKNPSFLPQKVHVAKKEERNRDFVVSCKANDYKCAQHFTEDLGRNPVLLLILIGFRKSWFLLFKKPPRRSSFSSSVSCWATYNSMVLMSALKIFREHINKTDRFVACVWSFFDDSIRHSTIRFDIRISSSNEVISIHFCEKKIISCLKEKLA